MNIGFHHGALCDSYEEQAQAQGFTFGDKAEWVQKVGFGLVCAHIHGCITDSEDIRNIPLLQITHGLPITTLQV